MEELEENAGRIIPINIETEMKSAYIDYSMSVIVSRALPDVRDGLKPHRRVLYGMRAGLTSNQSVKKSARTWVRYSVNITPMVTQASMMLWPDSHSHGICAICLSRPGNFGSVDGDR